MFVILMEGGKMVTVKVVPSSMPPSHVWEGLGGKFEGSNVKLLEGRRSHWSGLWCPHVRYFPFEGRQRKMLSSFHNVGRQCIRVVRGTVFVVIVVVQWHLCQTLCDHTDYSMPGLPVPHQLLEFAQVHVHWIGGAIQPSHPLTPFSPSSLGPSQHQRLFAMSCLFSSDDQNTGASASALC